MNLEITNFLIIFISAFIPLIVGALWYSQSVFGKLWMRAQNLTPEDQERMSRRSMVFQMATSYVAYLLMSYVLAVLVQYLVIASLIPALILGSLVWLGFVIPVGISNTVWSPLEKAWTLFYINISYMLVSILLVSVVIALWM